MNVFVLMLTVALIFVMAIIALKGNYIKNEQLACAIILDNDSNPNQSQNGEENEFEGPTISLSKRNIQSHFQSQDDMNAKIEEILAKWRTCELVKVKARNE